MPQLIQILLPLTTKDGAPFPQAAYAQVRAELTKQFGGLTAFTRAPAEGVWTNEGDRTSHDDIVVFEVMTRELDHTWWERYRAELERRFNQETIVMRAIRVDML